MPNREDEYWANEKDNLRYCAKHKKYYRADIGCQLCGYDRFDAVSSSTDGHAVSGEDSERPILKKCPSCKEKSLWLNKSVLWECLNLKCKRRFTNNEIERFESNEPTIDNLSDSPADGEGRTTASRHNSLTRTLAGRQAEKRVAVEPYREQVRRPRENQVPVAIVACAVIGVIAVVAFVLIGHAGKNESSGPVGSPSTPTPVESTSVRVIPEVPPTTPPTSTLKMTLSPRLASTPSSTSTPTPLPRVKLEELVQYTLDLINGDRKKAGLNPVMLGTNKAAQKHAEDMLGNYYLSHWGTDGLKPYMRYTLDGGFNYEAENSSYTGWYDRSKDPNRYVTIDVKHELEKAEHQMMYDDADSGWGHRDNILNRLHKAVNIGIAYDRHRLALVQQFEGDYLSFFKLPALQATTLSLSGVIQGGFTVDQIQVWYDPLTHSLTQGQLVQTRGYSLGKPAAFVRPPAPTGSYYLESDTFYSYEMPPDPYAVSPDAPGAASSGVILARPSILDKVKWVDAGKWVVSGQTFDIVVDLNSTISRFGKGVYTIVIWGENGSESESLSNYSIVVG